MNTALMLPFLTLYFSDLYATPLKKVTACSYYQERPLDQQRLCYIKVHLICGSDGRTYPNFCVLCYVQIESNNRIQFKHHGKC
ncbi:ovomucoid-like [Ornithorhynchus anatinus]|uniref:ovomucoid-like n=1 Tax=Ornithorhynchus anatinus TaxID=9258 RepID=UPI0004546466|nr:ovomucoid-like [Ornithorhynchus anatinus]